MAKETRIDKNKRPSRILDLTMIMAERSIKIEANSFFFCRRQ